MLICKACLEEAEELDEEGLCDLCLAHFDCEDAAREDAFRHTEEYEHG